MEKAIADLNASVWELPTWLHTLILAITGWRLVRVSAVWMPKHIFYWTRRYGGGEP